MAHGGCANRTGHRERLALRCGFTPPAWQSGTGRPANPLPPGPKLGDRRCQTRMPASRNSDSVSNSGRPITPEKLPSRRCTKIAARP